MRGFVLAAALLAAFPAAAQQPTIAVTDAWARASPGGSRMAAAYMMLVNPGDVADRLVGASSPAAENVELHTVVRDGDVMRMRPVAAIDVAARGSAELRPGGFHVMLIGVKAPLLAGNTFPLTLTFEKSGQRVVEVPVRGGAPAQDGHGGAHRQ